MDADFVRSVAAVGDHVEIRLAFGDMLTGTLTELNPSRLIVRQDDSVDVALMLGAIVWVRRSRPAQPAAAVPGIVIPQAAVPPAPVPQAPVPQAAASPEVLQRPVVAAPASSLQPPSPSVPPPPASAGAPSVRPESHARPTETVAIAQTPTEPSPVDEEELADDGEKDALDELAQMLIVPIRTRLLAAEWSHKQLESVCNSLTNAQRIHELSPKYNRVQELFRRAQLLLWNDQTSGDLHYLCGVLAMFNEDNEGAKPYLSTGAGLSGHPECWRLLAIASARSEDTNSAVFALVNYFKVSLPAVANPLWWLLLRLLDKHEGDRGVLHELVRTTAGTRAAAQLVTDALGGTAPPSVPMARPQGAMRRPFSGPRAPVRAAVEEAPKAKTPVRRGTREDPYVKAKRLDHREKDLTGAKQAYREAIRMNIRAESAVKDLAWLTKRMDGAAAALEVINVEYPGIVSQGDALDNILIDFHVGARNYDEALVVLKRQFARTDITDAKRNHLQHQIAYVKLSAGLDCVEDWRIVVRANPSAAARRGLALALIQRGEVGDLDKAEKAILGDTDEKSDDIRRRIEEIRNGEYTGVDLRAWAYEILGGLERLTITPLVNFVMQHYSSGAAKVRDQRKREGKRPSYSDARRLAETARQLRGHARESSADGYVSAAVIAWDSQGDDFQEFLCAGLTAVADVVLERQAPEAARSLYLEALRTSEGLDDPDKLQDTWLALTRFMRSLDGRRALLPGRGRAERPSIMKIITEQREHHGDRVFDLITQLMSQVAIASDQVLDAVCESEELTAAAVQYLSSKVEIDVDLSSTEMLARAWRRMGEQWAQEYSQAVAETLFLHDINLSDDLLGSVIERLDALPPGTLEPASVRRLTDSFQRLRSFLYEQSFEERDAGLRRTSELMKLIQQDIRQAPTRLAVEVVWPACEKVLQIVREATDQLLAQHKPEPELNLALTQCSVDKSGVITVQVKVANRTRAAPLESPTLICRDDPATYRVAESVLPLPTAVRGGDRYIQVVKLKVAPEVLAAGAFSLPVTLEYKARNVDAREVHEVTLPIRVLPVDDFEAIRNPFQDGASGRVVDRPEMFVGRDGIISRIFRNFDSAPSPGSGVAIFGQKRAGKSSIRLHLTRRLESESDFVVVDLENIGDFTPEPGESSSRRLVAALLWKIIGLADKAISARRGGGDSAPVTLTDGWSRSSFLNDDQPVSTFIDLVQSYLEQFPHAVRPRLIVLIDEFQYFDEWIRKGLLSSSFMQAMKALIERRLFHLVIVGQDAIERLIAENANVFGVFTKERVTYLDPQYAHELIDQPIQAGQQSRYRERAVDRIIELTGGSAFYIQKFCYALVEYMNEQRAPVVTEADVELVRDRFLQSIRDADFDNLETAGYTDIDQPNSTTYRKALQAVAIASKDGRAPYDRIAKVYQGTADLRPLIDDLVLRDVVREESGSYWIVVRLYQEWLLARTMVDVPAGVSDSELPE